MGPTELNDLTAPNYDFNEYLQYGKTVRPSQKQCFVVQKTACANKRNIHYFTFVTLFCEQIKKKQI